MKVIRFLFSFNCFDTWKFVFKPLIISFCYSNFSLAGDYLISKQTLELEELIKGKNDIQKASIIFRNIPEIRRRDYPAENALTKNYLENLLSNVLAKLPKDFKVLYVMSLDSFDAQRYFISDQDLQSFLSNEMKKSHYSGPLYTHEFFKNRLESYFKSCNLVRKNPIRCKLEEITKFERVRKNLTRGSTLLSLNENEIGTPEFLKKLESTLYKPSRNWKAKGYGLEKCWNKDFGYHEIGDTEGPKPPNFKVLNSECMPDTVYRWVPVGYLKFLEYNFDQPRMKEINWRTRIPTPKRGKEEGKLENTFFTARSPVSTFGYDWNLIRIKLKKPLVYKYFKGVGNLCPTVSDDDALKNVFVRVMWGMLIDQNPPVDSTPLPNLEVYFAEYDFCSMNVVHSISYDNEEIFDELIKDSIWNLSNSYLDNSNNEKLKLSSYVRMVDTGVPIPFFLPGYEVDKKVWSKKGLLARIKYQHIKLLQGGNKKILFNPGLGQQIESNPTKQFSTSFPNYWNTQTK